jgi:dienelactone hydrolase
VRFGLLGEKKAKPAPTLFVFATALEGMQGDSYYTAIVRLLAPHGFLGVALDPPCHGADAKKDEPGELNGWRARLEKGNDLVGTFTARASAVLDYLIKEGYTDTERVAVCGTSRGGFLAYHFAAADRRVKAAAGFSPVTNLLALREFAGLEKHEPTQKLSVVRHADRLAGRAVWVSIGNNDERVSTDDAIAFARRVVAASAASMKGEKRAIPVELVVGPSVGHSAIAQENELAAAWLLRQVPAARNPAP